MKIKICGMKDPENIAAVAAMGTQYMGFICYAPSPRYVGNDLNTGVISQKGIAGVGVFVNEKMELVQIWLEKHQLQHVQLHGEESPAYCQQLKNKGFTIIKAFRVGEDFDFKQTEPYLDACAYFLFDTKGKTHGGTGEQFDWGVLQQYTYNKPFFLSGGIGAEDVDRLLTFKHPQLHALDLNSRFEISPGLKDIEKLNYFFEQIHTKRL